MEDWRDIRFFPGYSVSTIGRVRNDDTGRMMTLMVNQSGVVNVGLTRSREQHRRAVALLVADAFIPRPIREAFDTPINLNGDRMNNTIDNLVWRPRWFAIKYIQQFKNNVRGFRVPVEEVRSGEQFPTSWEAAIKYGLLDREILIATVARTFVFPTNQKFRVL
jgi:hypothetical protein